MKKFTMGSILALLLVAMSACAPANQNSISEATDTNSENIIGGSVVMPGSALSKQVFMLFAISNQGQSICTATLISQYHVLTAAHCIDGVKKMYAVFAIDGVAKLKSGKLANLANDPNIVQVSAAKSFPGWGGSQGGTVSGVDAGDIAVLRLAKAAPAGVKVTKLYRSGLKKGQVLVASGYGISSGTIREGSGLLRETRVVVEEPMVGRSEFMIDQKSGRGICSGDSGGPSFVQGSFGELMQVGVTSRGDENCAEGGIYTLVPAFTSWINSAVSSLR